MFLPGVVVDSSAGKRGSTFVGPNSSATDLFAPGSAAFAHRTDLEEALEKLLALEKTHRLGADMVATKKVCIGIVQVCFFSGNFKLLNEHIILLSKRRSQLKQAVVGFVQEAMSYIDQVKDVETKTELISTLNTVTAGKVCFFGNRAFPLSRIIATFGDGFASFTHSAIVCLCVSDASNLHTQIYVEVERARLVRQLVKIKEEQGDIEAAAEAIQEVADRYMRVDQAHLKRKMEVEYMCPPVSGLQGLRKGYNHVQEDQRSHLRRET
eukprot:96410-Prorocentrum_minimum.AAC.1